MIIFIYVVWTWRGGIKKQTNWKFIDWLYNSVLIFLFKEIIPVEMQFKKRYLQGRL